MNRIKIRKSPYAAVKSFLKKVLRKKDWTLLAEYKNIFCAKLCFFYYPVVRRKYKKNLEKIRQKDKITVVFFVVHGSLWKCAEVYKLIAQDPRFDPVVVICPNINFGEEYMLQEMDKTHDSFLSKGYRVIKAYDENSQQWLDVKNKINPDIVFFTDPGKVSISRYYVANFLNCLTVYIPYGIMAANIQRIQYDLVFHNLIWRCYYETAIHKEMARAYATNKGINVVIAGFPMFDVFFNRAYSPGDVWKIKDRDVKRIIWAPHYSIENNKKRYAFANFLRDYQFMLDIAGQCAGRIQVAFKPHPMLKPALYNHPCWGKKRTDAYYQAWANAKSGQLEEGDYIDLFLTSDAMILDSISFITEYCCTGKPSLFLVRDETIVNKFNEYGRMAFDIIYKAANHAEVLDFINSTVLAGNDSLLVQRQAFIEKYFTPLNNQSAAKNIYDDLVKETQP